MARRSGTRSSIFSSAILTLLFICCSASSKRNCSKTSTLVGLEADFIMLQHQLRGKFHLLDGCSFRVSEFDMIEGNSVCWWGAVGSSFDNMTRGFQISQQKLNHTYKNDSFVVRLKENYTLDSIKVISVWDLPTESDFGHIVLEDLFNEARNSGAASPVAAPSPSQTGQDHKSLKTLLHKQPTMFDNCIILSPEFRLRWTLYGDSDFVDIGLEAAISSQNYMAFGWAHPGSNSPPMLHADVAVTGFTEEGNPFAEDYFITDYSECLLHKDGSVRGVCPDTIYEGSDPIGLVNNTKLLYGHRRDGISFIRYQRPLDTVDQKYDVVVKRSVNMTVVWALGLIKPPDTLRPYYLPQNHGRTPNVTYGYLTLNISNNVNECLGPLEAENREDQDIIFADGKTPLVVTSSPALHYPNPPNPAKVIYINNKEAPVLRVERGVPVQFSVQAGHDVALYITSDPIGGNATSRNMTEVIYAGGPEAEGVPASPKELVWLPDRNTPDRAYYQSFYGKKMGWKVHIVDGGLSDMYNNSVVLDDQQVTFFWTLSGSSISIAARGEKKSGYLAIAFGSGMVNSFAYVGWFDGNGTGHVSTYWIDGRDALNIHPTAENITNARCSSENGIITMEFSRPLEPSCNSKGSLECNNKIDPTTPLRVVWAMGAQWSAGHLNERNMHSATSGRPVRVLLLRGSAEAEQDLRPVLAVHGFMMFVAWGILLPGGILAARYLKHMKGDLWFRSHVYLQSSGLAIVLLGFLFAAAELRGFSMNSVHVKIGVVSIALACMQPLNACFRPSRPVTGDGKSFTRVLWEYVHVFSGRFAIAVGVAALITGMKHLGERYGAEDVQGLYWALIIWFVIGALLVVYLENWHIKQRRHRMSGSGLWVLGTDEEDDSVDLLQPQRERNPHPSSHMEVQLEPIQR